MMVSHPLARITCTVRWNCWVLSTSLQMLLTFAPSVYIIHRQKIWNITTVSSKSGITRKSQRVSPVNQINQFVLINQLSHGLTSILSCVLGSHESRPWGRKSPAVECLVDRLDETLKALRWWNHQNSCHLHIPWVSIVKASDAENLWNINPHQPSFLAIITNHQFNKESSLLTSLQPSNLQWTHAVPWRFTVPQVLPWRQSTS